MKSQQFITAAFLILFIFTSLISDSISIDKCSDSSSTLYDGYLDDFIYYAQFRKTSNSYYKFVNPFKEIGSPNTQNLTEATVSLWARFPQSMISANQATQQPQITGTGTFFDCQATLSARLGSGGILNLTAIAPQFTAKYGYQAITEVNQQYQNVLLNTTQALVSPLTQWNHYAFSYKDAKLMTFVNGKLLQSNSTSFLYLNTSSQFCIIGNNYGLNSPIDLDMRHLTFSNNGLIASTDYSGQFIQSIILPYASSPNILAYFKFGKLFNGMETYNYNVSRNYESNQVLISQSSEPETVCYCTTNANNQPIAYMNVTSAFALNPILVSNDAQQYNVDSNGFSISFYLYGSASSAAILGQGDISILTLQQYCTLKITNYTNTLKLDILAPSTDINKTTATSFQFTSFRIGYSFWTKYQITVTPTTATLFIDSQQIQQFTHSTLFPSILSQVIILQPPTGFSYLLYNFNLLNSKQQTVYSNNFTYDQFYPAATRLSAQGIVQFSANNELCYNQQLYIQNYWSGQACIDTRSFAFFNASANVDSSGTLRNSTLQAKLYSSQETQTIEFWFKDLTQVSNSSNNSKQILFDNSLDMKNSLVQIKIFQGDSSQNSNNKTLRCSSQAYLSDDQGIQLNNVSTVGQWVHVACISDKQNNQLKLVGYQSTSTGSAIFKQTVSGYIFIQQQQSIATTLGSSFNGLNKFVGFIREFKLWNVVRSDFQLELFRFNMINDMTPNLAYYYKLNSGYDQLTVRDSQNMNYNFVEQAPSSTTITWSTDDKDLVICQQTFFFNGQCCTKVDLSLVNFRIAYTQTTNFIVVSIDPATAHPNLINSIRANYTMLSVGNDFNYTLKGETYLYSAYLRPFFTKNMSASLNVSSIQILPKAYSIQIQAKLYSSYLHGVFVTKTQVLQLICPVIQLKILPSYLSDNPQIVSSIAQQPDYQVFLNIQQNCYDPKKGLYNVAIKSITWSHNISGQSFNDLFALNSDQTQVTAISTKKQLVPVNNPYLAITAKILYNTQSTATTQIYLKYQQLQIQSGLNSTSLQKSQLVNQPLQLDLSGAISTSSQYQLEYYLECPSSIFQGLTQYNNLCAFNKNGIFTLDNSQLNIIANYPYLFKFYMILQGTSIIESYTLNVTYYKDGGSSNCPRTFLNTIYYFNKNDTDPLEISPDTYLYCAGTYYNIYKQSWQLIESKSGKLLNSTLSYSLNSAYQRSALLLGANMGTLVQAGSTLNLTTIIYTKKENQNTVFLGDDTNQNFTVTTQIKVAQNPLFPQIKALYKNKTQFDPSVVVSFLEELVILDASDSFDPDQVDANLQFQWYCPPDVLPYYNCSQFIFGSQKQYLIINSLQRIRMNFQPSQTYSFILIVSSVDNPYKIQQTASIGIRFGEPLQSDTVSGTDMSPQCGESIGIPNLYPSGMVYSLNNTYQRVIRFDKLNATQIWFNIRQQTSQSCGKGSAVEQLIVVQVFGQNMNSLERQPLLVSYQNISSFQSDKTFNISLSQYQSLANQLMNSYTQLNVYQILYRSQSVEQIFINIQTIYLIKYPAMVSNYKLLLLYCLVICYQILQLQASTITQNVQIDKYSTLKLDSSSSYDPDGLFDSYFYEWICPSKSQFAVCTQQNGNLFSLSYLDRYTNGINDLNIPYNYTVYMDDPPKGAVFYPNGIAPRKSKPFQTKVTIFKRSDYSSCVTTNLNSATLNSYSETQNRTIFILYNQKNNISIEIIVSTQCENINLYAGVWQQTNQNSNFSNLYSIDPTQSRSITLLASMYNIVQVGSLSQLAFQQNFSMGLDTDVVLSSTSYFNVLVTLPDLVINLTTSNYITFLAANGSNTALLDGSNSYDPIQKSYTCQWDCPTYFGGYQCSQSCSLQLNQNSLSTLFQLTSYLSKSHNFNFTIISEDGIRRSSRSFYLYLADPTIMPYSISQNIKNCRIQSANSSQLYLNFSSFTSFKFSCKGDSNLEQYIMNNYDLNWSIEGLTETTDYYTLANVLYLRPYILYKLMVNPQILELKVSLRFGANTPIDTSASIRRAFKLRANMLKYTDILLNAADDDFRQSAYTTIFNVQFVNFHLSDYTGLLFQLRAKVPLYDSYLIIISLKEFREDIIKAFYSSITLPQITELYVDFFDMNLVYVGSYDIYTTKLTQYSLGLYQYYQYDLMIQPIIQKSGYSNNNDGMISFENDMKSLLEATEMLQLNRVYGASQSLLNDYAQKMLIYLSNNFQTMILRMPLNGTIYTREAHYVNEIRVIYTLKNLVSKSTNLDITIAAIVNILSTVIKDYDEIMNRGDQSPQFRSTLIYLVQVLQYQLPTLTVRGSNKTELTSTLNKIMTRLIGVELQTIQEGQVSEYTSNQMTRLYYKLVSYSGNNSGSTEYTDAMPSILIKSATNGKDSVQIIDQIHTSKLNVSALEVLIQQSSNVSNPAVSQVEINAYDRFSNLVDLSINQHQDPSTNTSVFQATDSLFKIQMQLKASFVGLFNQSQNNSDDPNNVYQYQPVCVYYDEILKQWSQKGVQTGKYNSLDESVTCTTTHLSIFGIDYALTRTSIRVQDQQLGSQYQNVQYFFSDKQRGYQALIAVACIMAFLLILSTFFYDRQWDYSDQNIVYQNPEANPKQILMVALKQLHPLFSLIKFKDQKISNIRINVPKINKALALLLHFFSIALPAELALIYLDHKYEWNSGQCFALIVILITLIQITRSITSTVMYSIHFYKQKNNKSSALKTVDYKSNEFDDISKIQPLNNDISSLGDQDKSKEGEQALKSYTRDSPCKMLSRSEREQQFELQMEGGEPEESSKNEEKPDISNVQDQEEQKTNRKKYIQSFNEVLESREREQPSFKESPHKALFHNTFQQEQSSFSFVREISEPSLALGSSRQMSEANMGDGIEERSSNAFISKTSSVVDMNDKQELNGMMLTEKSNLAERNSKNFNSIKYVSNASYLSNTQRILAEPNIISQQDIPLQTEQIKPQHRKQMKSQNIGSSDQSKISNKSDLNGSISSRLQQLRLQQQQQTQQFQARHQKHISFQTSQLTEDVKYKHELNENNNNEDQYYEDTLQKEQQDSTQAKTLEISRPMKSRFVAQKQITHENSTNLNTSPQQEEAKYTVRQKQLTQSNAEKYEQNNFSIAEMTKRTLFTVYNDEDRDQVGLANQDSAKHAQSPETLKASNKNGSSKDVQDVRQKRKDSKEQADNGQKQDIRQFYFHKQSVPKLAIVALMIAILVIFMTLTFYYMQYFKDRKQFVTWIGVLFATFLTLILFVDTVMLTIYAILFKRCEFGKKKRYVSQILLLDNLNLKFMESILYQLNE